MTGFLVDNILAVLVGSALLLTLLTLQLRDRQHVITETVSHAVRVQLYDAMEVVGDDLENMWSPEEAVEDSGESLDASSLAWRVDTLATGDTGTLSFPSAVSLDITRTNRRLAEVTYTLIPTTDTVWVAGAPTFRHTLVRSVSFAQLSPDVTPSATVDTLSRDLLELRLGFVSGVVDDRVTWHGDAPATTHSISLSSMAGRPAPARLSQEVANLGFSNAVSYGSTFTPKNI